MASKLDKFMETAGGVAAGALDAAGELVNKGYDKANELALSAKISKIQRQLGALVYALRKNGQENEPMIQWYMGELDRLKAQLPENDTIEDELPDDEVYIYGEDTPGDDPDAMFRGGNGDKFP